MFNSFGPTISISFNKNSEDKYGKNGVVNYRSQEDAENAMQVIGQMFNEDGEKIVVFTYSGKL